MRGGGFFGDAAVVTGSSKPVFAAHVNEVVRCVGGVKRIRPTVRGVDAGQVVRWCGSPLGEVGMGCQRLRQALACMCGRGPGGACGHAAPALDAACAEVVVLRPFMSSTVALAAAALEGMTGGACGQWWRQEFLGNFLVLQHVWFLGKFSGGRECAEVLVQAAGHLCMWRRCRERVSLVGGLPGLGWCGA